MANKIKYIIVLFVAIFFPPRFKGFILSKMGHKIGRKFSAGPFLLLPDTRLTLEDDVKFGYFNIFFCDSIKARNGCGIGSFNVFRGWFSIRMDISSFIGSFNTFSSKGKRDKSTKSWFVIGNRSNVTGHHFFDLTKSIIFKDNSVLGGRSSQIWTHGFFHSNKGIDRTRVDGGVIVDEGVYIGSAAIINPGIYIGKDINIGAGTVVSRSLFNSGMYVSNKMVHIEMKYENVLSKYKVDDDHISSNKVCKKKIFGFR